MVLMAPARLFEWVVAGIMAAMALGLAVDARAIEVSSFRPILATGIVNQAMINALVAAGAILRLIGLIANGRWEYSGTFRALGALAGAVLWTTFAWALFGMTQITNSLTPGVYVYIGLTIGELISCYRAVRDAKR